MGELAICNAGGIIRSNDCSDLNKCCDQMLSDGYPDEAETCKTQADDNNSSSCKSWLSTYRGWNWCN